MSSVGPLGWPRTDDIIALFDRRSEGPWLGTRSPMHVAVCRLTLRFPENQNLKGKRRAIGSLRSKVRNKFNVSIVEVGDNTAFAARLRRLDLMPVSIENEEILGLF